MNATTFDTLEAAKELRAAGFSEAQAEAVTRIFKQAGQVDLSDLATKADLQSVKADLQGIKAELHGVKTDLAGFATRADLVHFATKADLAEMKADIFKWAVPPLLGQAALIAALVKLL